MWFYRRKVMKISAVALVSMHVVFFTSIASVQTNAGDKLGTEVDRLAKVIENKVIEWRRDFHQHPELSNREFRTSKIVAEHLENLGMEVQTGVAHTGVVGILRGKKDSPVIALRADMDALPVTEALDLPFASKVKAEYNGVEVGVPHDNIGVDVLVLVRKLDQ